MEEGSLTLRSYRIFSCFFFCDFWQRGHGKHSQEFDNVRTGSGEGGACGPMSIRLGSGTGEN